MKTFLPVVAALVAVLPFAAFAEDPPATLNPSATLKTPAQLLESKAPCIVSSAAASACCAARTQAVSTHKDSQAGKGHCVTWRTNSPVPSPKSAPLGSGYSSR